MKKVFIQGFFYFCLLLVATSCYRKEDFDMGMWAEDQSVPYDLAIPLFETRLTVDNMLSVLGQPENFVPEESTGLIHVIYALETPIDYQIGSQYNIPDINMSPFSISSIPYWKKDTIISAQISDTTELDIRGLATNAALDKILIDSLVFKFTGVNTVEAAAVIKIEFENLLESNGAKVKVEIPMEANVSPGASISLHNVSLLLEGMEDPVISYKISYAVDLNTAPNEYPTVRTGSISFVPKLQTCVFSRLEGFLGTIEPPVFSDYIDVSALANPKVEKFKFHQGNIRLFTTIYGASLPFTVKESAISVDFDNGMSDDLDMYEPDYIIPYPTPNEYPLEKLSEMDKDLSQTNILENFPRKIKYNIKGVINEESSSSAINIIEKNSGFRFNMACDIPLDLTIQNYILDDTINFNGIANASVLFKNFEMKGVVSNAFPISLLISLDVLDENNQVLFSVIENDTVESGIVGPKPEMHVITPTMYKFSERLNREEMALLEVAKKIRVWAVVNTYMQDEVKIYANQENEGYLNVKLGAHASMQVGAILPKPNKP